MQQSYHLPTSFFAVSGISSNFLFAKGLQWTFWLLLFPGTSLAKFNCAHNFASVGDSAFSVAPLVGGGPLWLSTCHSECPLKPSFVLISRPLQKWWCYFEAGFGMSYKIKPWLYEKPEEDKQLTQTWIRPKHMLYQGRERENALLRLCFVSEVWMLMERPETCYDVSGFRHTYRILGPKALSSARFQPKCPRVLMDRDEGPGRWGKAPCCVLGFCWHLPYAHTSSAFSSELTPRNPSFPP